MCTLKDSLSWMRLCILNSGLWVSNGQLWVSPVAPRIWKGYKQESRGKGTHPEAWLDLPLQVLLHTHWVSSVAGPRIRSSQSHGICSQLGLREQKESDYDKITERNGSTRPNHNLATQTGIWPSPRQWVYSWNTTAGCVPGWVDTASAIWEVLKNIVGMLSNGWS